MSVTILINSSIKNYIRSISQKYNIPKKELLSIWKVDKKQPKIITEDLGKIFEKAICNLYDIEYEDKYKYSLEEAENIKQKLFKLKKVFPHKIKHVAKNGNKYDFVSIENGKITLSAKSSKKDGKVCPQVIGQPSKKKFCQFFNIENNVDDDIIKKYIEINVNSMLYQYINNTFDSPIVYYNKHKDLLLFVILKQKINWNERHISFSHIIKCKKWNESTNIIIDNTVVGEFQVHNHRDCIKFRWNFEKMLNLFKDNFQVENLRM